MLDHFLLRLAMLLTLMPIEQEKTKDVLNLLITKISKKVNSCGYDYCYDYSNILSNNNLIKVVI